MSELSAAAVLASRSNLGVGGALSLIGAVVFFVGVSLLVTGRIPGGRLANYPSARRPMTIAGIALALVGLILMITGLAAASSKRGPLIAVGVGLAMSIVFAAAAISASHLQSRRTGRAPRPDTGVGERPSHGKIRR